MKFLLNVVRRSVVESTHPQPNVLMDAACGVVEACASEVEAAGCQCRSLWLAFRRARLTCGYDGEYRYEGDDFVVIRHDTRCPIALAAHLREMLR